MRKVIGTIGSVALAACALGSLMIAGSGGAEKHNTKAVAGENRRLSALPYVWKNVEIVGGGFVTSIVFSPKQPGLAYARTDIGGAYRWNPARKRWIPLLDWVSQAEANLLGVESVAADPTDARRVYLAIGTYTQPWASNGAILRSADQGQTWQRTDMPFKMGSNEDGRSIGERLAVDPNKNSILYFGSRHDGLWKSSDYGVTWNKVGSFPITGRTNGIGIGFVIFDPRRGAPGSPTPTLFAGVAAPGVTLFQSKDGGATWESVPGQPTGLLPHHAALDKDGALYLTYSDGLGPNGVSAGAVWKLDTKTGGWTDITPIKPGTESAGNFGYAGLALDVAHPGTVMVTTLDRWSHGDEIFRSTNGGAVWKALGAKTVRDSSGAPFLNWGGVPKLGWWIGDIAIDPFRSDHILYVTGATIWGTDDATNADADSSTHWTVRAQGLEETAVLDLLSPPSGAHLLSGLGDIGGFRHDDLTVSPRVGMMSNPIFGSTDSLDFAAQRPAIMARVGSAGSNQRRGAYSLDGGKTWTPFAAEPPGSRGSGSIALSADGSVLLWTPHNGQAHYSTDRGATWTACKGVAGRVSPVCDRADPRRFYAFDSTAGTLLISEDGGARFAVKAQGLPTSRGRLRAAPDRAGDLWLTMGNGGLYHATDAGARFAKLEAVQEADALGFGKAAPGQSYPALYLTGKVDGVAGVFRSDDAGATWARINDDRHQYGWIGQVITGDPRLYGRVYLGTNGRGILYADPAPAAAK